MDQFLIGLGYIFNNSKDGINRKEFDKLLVIIKAFRIGNFHLYFSKLVKNFEKSKNNFWGEFDDLSAQLEIFQFKNNLKKAFHGFIENISADIKPFLENKTLFEKSYLHSLKMINKSN